MNGASAKPCALCNGLGVKWLAPGKAYLIATPQGHSLINTGMTEMHDAITTGVEQLGYTVSDIRILLASHAHFITSMGTRRCSVAPVRR
jgi:metallo-beta-lactamase class B